MFPIQPFLISKVILERCCGGITQTLLKSSPYLRMIQIKPIQILDVSFHPSIGHSLTTTVTGLALAKTDTFIFPPVMADMQTIGALATT